MGLYDADLNTPRLAIRRAELVETKDSGELQEVTALGYDEEQFKLAHRAQPFGLSSNAPKGSHGVAVVANGRPDQTVLLGMEHPEFRPRNLPEGATKLYDKDGSFVYLDAAGNLFAEVKQKANVKAGSEATVEAPTIKLKGAVTIEGTLHVAGNVTTIGSITSTGPHIAAGHI